MNCLSSQNLQTCTWALLGHSRISEKGVACSADCHLCMTPVFVLRETADGAWTRYGKSAFSMMPPAFVGDHLAMRLRSSKGVCCEDTLGKLTARDGKNCLALAFISHQDSFLAVHGLGGALEESAIPYKDFLPILLFSVPFLTMAQIHEPFWGSVIGTSVILVGIPPHFGLLWC